MSRTHKKRERESFQSTVLMKWKSTSQYFCWVFLSLSLSIHNAFDSFESVLLCIYFFVLFLFSSFVHCNLWNTQRIKYPVEIMWYGIYVPGVYLSMSWTWSGGGLCLPCAPPSHHSVILSGDLWSSICINILFPWTHFYVLEYLNTLCTYAVRHYSGYAFFICHARAKKFWFLSALCCVLCVLFHFMTKTPTTNY